MEKKKEFGMRQVQALGCRLASGVSVVIFVVAAPNF